MSEKKIKLQFHELIDNETLLYAHDKWEEHQGYHKQLVRALNIIKASIHDAHEPNQTAWLNSLIPDYATKKEFDDEVIPLYIKCGTLYEELTERQQNILYMFICQDMKLNEVAKYFDISSPGVIKTLKLIQKKAIKIFGKDYFKGGFSE